MKTWRWTLLFVSAGALAFACSVEDNSSDDDNLTTSTGTGASGGGATSTTSSVMPMTSSTGGMMGCYQEGSALLAPGDTTQTGLNLCTPVQIDGFYTACLDAASTMQTCMDYQTANQACNDCILPVDAMGNSAGSTPVLLPGDMFIYANVYACEAAAQMKPQCGPPASQYFFCLRTACETCPEGDQAAFDACIAQAEAGVCADAAAAITMECETVFADMLSPQCDGMDFQEFYTLIGNFFCGPPA